MSDILIVTAHTGYNYGTYLQAFAMKKLMKEFADNADIIWQKSFGPSGRDYRIKKILTIGCRSVLNYRKASAIKQGYMKNLANEPNTDTKLLFDLFSKEYLCICEYSYKELKEKAKNENTKAVVCGSDQIWNASSMYPDPLYYLQFVPQNKRIAYAPSFGRSEVPDYNKRIIKKYLNAIPCISVREEAGADIVNSLTGREVPVVPDPTIVVDWDDWMSSTKENILLLYFLDEPSKEVVKEIKHIQKTTGYKVRVLLYKFECFEELDNIELVKAGPKEFVEEISRARFVCTDSFHATIFSILSRTPFYTYKRNYGKVDNQESRLETLLNHYELQTRYRNKPGNMQSLSNICDMSHITQINIGDKELAYKYIQCALNKTE